MIRKIYYFFPVLFMLTHLAFAQTVIPLYPGDIPNAITAADMEETSHTDRIRVSKVSKPTLTVFLPPKEKMNGTSVLICPGGGYSIIAIGHEGYDVAREFNKIGVTAFVLKYRLPDDRIMQNKETGPLQDALQGIKTIRENAAAWNIDPNRVGIMGFSAGGHLASTAGTRFGMAIPGFTSSINLRPDFMILIYPVVSFTDQLTHLGSRTKLLGPAPSPEKIKVFSPELNVTMETPPAFLVHAGDDKSVKVGNSMALYEALNANGINAELHIYPKGGHGFGLINPTTPDLWFERCKNWMTSHKWL